MYFTAEGYMSPELQPVKEISNRDFSSDESQDCTESSTEDYVNHPKHYERNGKECIDVIEEVLTPEEYLGYLKGTAIKYIWRHPFKWNPSEDLDKATWYIKRAMVCPALIEESYPIESGDVPDYTGSTNDPDPDASLVSRLINQGIYCIAKDRYVVVLNRISHMRKHLTHIEE